jgi:hypothetical protein
VRDIITGQIYLERGKPVVVLIRWSGTRATPWTGIPLVWWPRLMASLIADPARTAY